MAHAHSRATKRPFASAQARKVRPLFFKSDHPRAIDRYIDYFGGAGGGGELAVDDHCGETLLERLA
jgi:hypothetical protein